MSLKQLSLEKGSSSVVICDDLNKNGPPRLRGSRIIGGVALLVEVRHWGGFGAFRCPSQAQYLFLLPANPDVACTDPSAARLPTHCLAPCHEDNGLKLQNCNPAPIKCFPL